MKPEWKLQVFNASGEEVFYGKVTLLPLSDELIVKKSIEFFNDEAPCFIHRSAVMKRLYMELEAFFAEKFGENPRGSLVEIAKGDIPCHIRLIVESCGDVAKICCCI